MKREYRGVKAIVVLPTMLTPQGPATMTMTYEKAKRVEIDEFGTTIETDTGEVAVWNREAYQRIDIDPHGSIVKGPGIIAPQ